MKAKNVMEVLIRDKMDELNDELPLSCTCPQCLEDVISITLNQFPPHYAAREEGVAYVKAKFSNRQDSVTLMSEILKSCQVVSQSPSHS